MIGMDFAGVPKVASVFVEELFGGGDEDAVISLADVVSSRSEFPTQAGFGVVDADGIIKGITTQFKGRFGVFGSGFDVGAGTAKEGEKERQRGASDQVHCVHN